MSDLISRKDAINAISRYGSVWVEYTDVMSKSEIAGKALKSAKDEMICILKDLPDAEKKGKWRHYEGVLTCMECGAEFYDDIMEYTGDEVPHFCPDCGANMEG